jgi:predicted nuclease of predicted toxin-antitoxin system
MKFVADVNVPKPLIKRLRIEGHEVILMVELDRRRSDRGILRMALDEDALVITFDKDFRYHTLEEGQPTLGVILVRLARLRGEAETERVVQVIREQGEQFFNHLTTIYPDRVITEDLSPSREYWKGVLAGRSAFYRDFHRLTTEYNLTEEEALEVPETWSETKLKDWAEGKGPRTRKPPEIEIPEKYKNRRQPET